MTGCETTPINLPTTSSQPAVSVVDKKSQVATLLSKADKSTNAQAIGLRIQAAQLALKENNFNQARTILYTIGQISNPIEYTLYILLQAEITLQSGDTKAALVWLHDPRLTSYKLKQQDKIKIGQMLAQAYFIERNFLASARERIYFDELLDPAEQEINQHEIFTALMELPADELTSRAKNSIMSDIRGWLSLAAMTRQYQNEPLRQLQELRRWQTAWRNHPASINLPKSLRSLSLIVRNQPKTIALLLPLQGSLGAYGRAIRDGLIGARYHTETNVKVNIYDSSQSNIKQLINQAVANNAEIIIGPLDRTKVTAIAHLKNLPVPILALNRTTDFSSHQDLYQFGLAPEDEMIQVANQAFREGKRNVLAIYPASDWGTRNFDTFKQQWLKLGGNIIQTADYTSQNDYSSLIKALLNVDLSELRAKDVRRILGQKIEFTPRRRQDIDFIFLLGNQAQARGINPTLAFYYAEDIPVYSTSHIYEYNESRIESIDLNGIRFCDIPWKLTNNDPVQKEIQTHWDNTIEQLAPFYAMGVDAFRLYPRLQQLKLDQSKIYGSTGILNLNRNNVLERELLWASFSKGQVISSPVVYQSDQNTNQ
ncbi:MAG: penicillin-binding protein activator [Pseudomonadales bacterium]|nr:penicillin-binding protein activator [Pseudomonadales bacterium]